MAKEKLCACKCLLLSMLVHTASLSWLMMRWRQQLMQATLVELGFWRCPHAASTKAYLYTADHSLTTMIVFWALLTHICVLPSCLCLTYVVLKCPTFHDGTRRRETDITIVGQWSDEADLSCSSLHSQDAHSSHFLTYILTRHRHMSC